MFGSARPGAVSLIQSLCCVLYTHEQVREWPIGKKVTCLDFKKGYANEFPTGSRK